MSINYQLNYQSKENATLKRVSILQSNNLS